ncbi:MAG: nicotinate-nucleotide--dimethylbenzimidazole phosphoribosyltransferase [Candidatus Firestonebacteria bacterium]|nr:nicotinate-nucleotide--dimethylbenzimidazole phosphoribosyltransferase [Candidatus Firestonebacteria bacterium]
MDLLRSTVEKIQPVDKKLIEKAQAKLDMLTKPQGSLGRLEDLAKKIVVISGKLNPKLESKKIITIAGDHGVVEEGVSAYPKEVSAQMVYNFVRGGAAINVLAKHIGAEVIVVDIGVAHDFEKDLPIISKKIGYGTINFVKGPAMTREEAIKSIEAGIEIVNKIDKLDILGIGEMGIGNTTPSSAIISVFSGLPANEVTGRGTGIDDKTLKNKIRVIEKGIQINKPDINDPIDVLAKIGGFEIGGLAGCVLAASARKIPIVLDGLISTAGALIASKIAPVVKEYLIASHNSEEIGHKIMLKQLNLEPLFNFNLRLGEGTGACLGISMADAGIKIFTEMATFESAGVSEKSQEK